MQLIEKFRAFFLSFTYEMLISLLSVLLIWSTFCPFSPWHWRLHLKCSTLVGGSGNVWIFRYGTLVFFSEPWMGIRTHNHQCPWFLRYNISVRISCWILVSILLGTFYGDLSPGALYIGRKLMSIIPISVISKYYYFKIMVISFRMLYHLT